jgi:hypothetical protein
MRGGRSERGAALIVALVVMLITAGLAVGFLTITASETRTTGSSMDMDRALHVAETGVPVAKQAADLAAALGLGDLDPTDAQVSSALGITIVSRSDSDVDDLIGASYASNYGAADYDVVIHGSVCNQTYRVLLRYDSGADAYNIVSVGFHGGVFRIVEAGLKAGYGSPFALGMFAKTELDYQGTADSYNSNLGAYNPQTRRLPDGSTGTFHSMNAKLGSNGDTTIEGGSTIYGDAKAGPDPGDDFQNNGTIWGDSGNLEAEQSVPNLTVSVRSASVAGVTVYTDSYDAEDPLVEDPAETPATISSADPTYYLGDYTASGGGGGGGGGRGVGRGGGGGGGGGNQSTTLNTGVYHANSINLTGNKTVTIRGKVVIYVNGPITIGGNSAFDVSNGELVIYQTSSNSGPGSGLTLNGQVMIGNTSDYDSTKFRIYTNQNSVTVNGMGSGKFVGLLYAPQAQVTLNGGVDIYGAVIADKIKSNGAAGSFHYDEALGQLGGSTKTYGPTFWFLRK